MVIPETDGSGQQDRITDSAATEQRLYPVLLAAAEHMREHHGADHPRHHFWLALAEWLEDVGAKEQARYHAVVRIPVLYFREALVIADTYMASVAE